MIGATLTIEGSLTGDEDIEIEGRFGGEIKLLKSRVVIGGTGEVTANVKAKTVTINGTAQGDVEAGEQVEITATGSMKGDIRSPRVILHDGAKFRGRIDMEPDGIEEDQAYSVRTPRPPSKGELETGCPCRRLDSASAVPEPPRSGRVVHWHDD